MNRACLAHTRQLRFGLCAHDVLLLVQKRGGFLPVFADIHRFTFALANDFDGVIDCLN